MFKTLVAQGTDGCNSTTVCCPLDGNSCDANSKFLMDPISNAGEMQFSPCSLGKVCESFNPRRIWRPLTCYRRLSDVKHCPEKNKHDMHAWNPTRQTITLQVCGNDIVEPGEECDPGKGFNSTCCDSSTCQFTAGSVCDPMRSTCCSSECTFAPFTQVCRPSRDSQCDVAEIRTGNSSVCPADVAASNGKPFTYYRATPNNFSGKSCGANGQACASGQCTGASTQCQAIGASMNLQNACPNPDQNQNCRVTCQDPTQSSLRVVLQPQLVDRSPCSELPLLTKLFS